MDTRAVADMIGADPANVSDLSTLSPHVLEHVHSLVRNVVFLQKKIDDDRALGRAPAWGLRLHLNAERYALRCILHPDAYGHALTMIFERGQTTARLDDHA